MRSLWEEARPTPQGWREADPYTVYQHLSEVRLVDVREPDELAGELGRAPGAESVPLATVRAHFQRGDHDETIVVICRSGGRSARAAGELVDMGYRRVINLAGGMLEWTAMRLPVERGAAGLERMA